MPKFSPLNFSNCTVTFYDNNNVLLFGPVAGNYADYRRLAQPDVPFGDPRAARDEQPTSILSILKSDTYYPLVGHKIVFTNADETIMNGEYVIKQMPRAYGTIKMRRRMADYWVLPIRALAPERVYESTPNPKDKSGTITFA